MMQVYGIDAIIRIVSHLAFIYLAFWSLRSLRTETFFKYMQNTTQIRMVIVFFSIFLGYTASNFFLEIIALCRNLFVSI
ncbi:membrane protein [Enterococcus thailandicus]|nr:membrane protein [Enterococcus thailandicus]